VGQARYLKISFKRILIKGREEVGANGEVEEKGKEEKWKV
jgi:hypothetical protein